MMMTTVTVEIVSDDGVLLSCTECAFCGYRAAHQHRDWPIWDAEIELVL